MIILSEQFNVISDLHYMVHTIIMNVQNETHQVRLSKKYQVLKIFYDAARLLVEPLSYHLIKECLIMLAV